VIDLILLGLGLLVGAVFLGVLLIGDKKEARLEAQKKALQEQVTQASQPVAGAWPPPPDISALHGLSQPTVLSPKPGATRAANQKMVRMFFLIRNYAVGTVILAYIIYSCLPRFNFGWILLATALAAAALWGVTTMLRRSKKLANRL
jgi:hypothetical protein